MKIISVVRDFQMYNKCIKDNPYCANIELVVCDNSIENKTITTRYNEFLDAYDYTNSDWFVFCHEDWEVKEYLVPHLDVLFKGAIYGPIGMSFGLSGFLNQNCIGQIENSDKNGDNCRLNGVVVPTETEVGTLDCQCIIVHSSLVDRYNLRFDE